MKRDRHIVRILLTAFAAAALLPPCAVYAQKGLPTWVDEGWRNAKYPQGEWYAGFAQDAVRKGTNASEAQRRVEKEAQNRMAQGISVRIAASSSTYTSSQQTRNAAGMNETIKKDYGQIIEATTNAEVVKSELYSHYDPVNDKVYAFAAVKKSELVDYYVSRILYYLQMAGNDFTMAKQYVESDRTGGALERLAESKKSIGECGKYQELLTAVDYRGDAAKLLDRTATLLKEVSALEIKLREAGTIYVTGKETIAGQSVNIIASALQSRLSENKCRVVNDPAEAGYIISIEAKECNTVESGKFRYCNACVNVDITTNSGKNEAKINFMGGKDGWTSTEKACEKAFDRAADELWQKIQSKTEICK